MKMMLNRLYGHKNRRLYLVLFLVFGMLLMLFPTEKQDNLNDTVAYETEYSLEKEEKRLENVLSSVKGVGDCKVLLSIHNGTETILAKDEGETVVISEGNTESPITLSVMYPRFQGAVIIIGGYSDASVRFDVLSAVMSYTGLETDKITICPMAE